MRREKLSRALALLSVSVAVAGTTGATAHESDLSHWFEHQRAFTDGGAVGIFEADSAPKGAKPASRNTRPPKPPTANPQPANGSRADAVTPRRSAKPRVDCFIEQLQMTDGHVPSGECPVPPHAAERWIVDEDKQMGRHWQGERPR